MAIPSWIQNLARPEDVRTIRTAIPGYPQNRERAGLVVHKGFRYYDKYVEMKPTLFWGSLIGAATSGYLWWRRKHHAEAHVLYPLLTAGLGTVAWLTRPMQETKGCPPPGETADEGDNGVLVWLDKEVAKAKQKDPDFADRAFQRLVKTCAVKPMWQETPDYLKAMVI